MTIDRVRHGRQIRLPEIGEAGQERLGSSTVALGGAGDALEIESAYVKGAGITVRETADGDAKAKAGADAKAHELLLGLALKDSAARDVADGALRALCAMRKILGIAGAGGTG